MDASEILKLFPTIAGVAALLFYFYSHKVAVSKLEEAQRQIITSKKVASIFQNRYYRRGPQCLECADHNPPEARFCRRCGTKI